MFIQVGIVNRSNPSTNLRLLEYEKVAKEACGVTSFEEAHSLYPDVPLFDLPYLCMDLVYVYTVLVDGFGKHTRNCWTFYDLIFVQSRIILVIFSIWQELIQRRK